MGPCRRPHGFWVLNAQITISAGDYHTAGEPFRIISGGVPAIYGDTVLDKRLYAMENLDHIRELVINEPRGHSDMYGCFVVEPDDQDADFGVVFFHEGLPVERRVRRRHHRGGRQRVSERLSPVRAAQRRPARHGLPVALRAHDGTRADTPRRSSPLRATRRGSPHGDEDDLGDGRVAGAERLIDVSSAHIDGCLFHGRAGLDFAERLASAS